MSETKIQLHDRKIQRGRRKSLEAQQKQIWDKLSTPSQPRLSAMDIEVRRVIAKSRKLKTTWKLDPDISFMPMRSEVFDEVIINEWVTTDDSI